MFISAKYLSSLLLNNAIKIATKLGFKTNSRLIVWALMITFYNSLVIYNKNKLYPAYTYSDTETLLFKYQDPWDQKVAQNSKTDLIIF